MLFLKGVIGSIVAGGILVGGGVALSSHIDGRIKESMSAFRDGRESRDGEIKDIQVKSKEAEKEMKIILGDNKELEKDNDKLTAENMKLKSENERLNKQQARCENRRKNGYYWCETR